MKSTDFSLYSTISHYQAIISSVIPLFVFGDTQLVKADDVYFGVGCFWHVQHEFVKAEQDIHGRSNEELSSRAGYAGGRIGTKGPVCYHNFQGIGDYGEKGYGEVVSMNIPPKNIKDFAAEYFSLFGADGERPDKV